jgi:hypothetical protein
MTKTHPTPRERAAKHPKSVKLAVAAFCFYCQGGENSETPTLIKARVRDCGTVDCPLHPHRGWKKITTIGIGNRRSPKAQAKYPRLIRG